MKPQKLPSGSYRVRKTIDGKVYSKTFEKKPTKREIDEWVAELMTADEPECDKNSFEHYANAYINAKSNVLSASTIRGYKIIIKKNLSKEFLAYDINSINQEKIQVEINTLAAKKHPKTVKNIHGFVAAVLGMYRPSLAIRTTLPRAVPPETYVPSSEDLAKILSFAKGKSYELAILLGMHGLRESEAICVTDQDVVQEGDDYYLNIHKAKIRGDDGYIVQNYTKTENSYRTIPIDAYTAKLLLEQKIGWSGYPTGLWANLDYAEKKFDIPHFKYHALRHYFVTKCHAEGVPDAVIRKVCGFSSNYVMDKHYKHALDIQMSEAVSIAVSNVVSFS